jgi:hypothetical protein
MAVHSCSKRAGSWLDLIVSGSAGSGRAGGLHGGVRGGSYFNAGEWSADRLASMLATELIGCRRRSAQTLSALGRVCTSGGRLAVLRRTMYYYRRPLLLSSARRLLAHPNFAVGRPTAQLREGKRVQSSLWVDLNGDRSLRLLRRRSSSIRRALEDRCNLLGAVFRTR